MDHHPVRDKQGHTEEEFLQSYDASQFERPSMTVDMLIFTVKEEQTDNYRKLSEKSLQLLLIKRGGHPFLGQWALPGGFVSVHESIEDAARRELRAETNIDHHYLEQLYTWGEVDRDPRTRVVSCSYMALVDSSQLQVQAGDDAERAEWFHIWDTLFEEKKTHTDNGYVWEKWIELKLWNDEESLSAILKITKTVDGKIVKTKREIVESRGIAFDHATMILYGLERLRNKLEYTDIVFHLMPDLFTLSELQQVYEVILGKELLAAAFRRKIAEKVQETNEYTKNAGHRPSKLYRYHAGWSDVF